MRYHGNKVIKTYGDLMHQTMGFLFMLSGSSAMHGRIYQLDCGYRYIRVISGNDDGCGRLERWEGGENG